MSRWRSPRISMPEWLADLPMVLIVVAVGIWIVVVRLDRG
jgi:hypothetical protein